MAIGPITDFISLEDRQESMDITGLGRWLVILLKGDGIKTRIVCGYNPCYNNNPTSSTTYTNIIGGISSTKRKISPI
jgi:hypothetical protein